MTKRLPAPVLLAVCVAGLSVVGYWLLFTTFMVYDDEGYVLWSLHNYVNHGRLYSEVYSQYGPFFFSCHYALARLLGFGFNNETGRILTLINWVGTAALCGALIWRLTRSLIAMAASSVLVFVYLWIMINEPSHPGGLLTLLAAIGAVVGAWAIEQERPRLFAVVTALVGAAMALTKINVGAFFLFAAGAWLLINTGNDRASRQAAWLVALGCVAVPGVLMAGLFAENWVTTYALDFAAAALVLVFLLHRAHRREHDRTTWIAFIGTGLLLGGLVTGLTCARGTSLLELWHGVVMDPLRQPGIYHTPVQWLPGTRQLVLGSLAIAVLGMVRVRITGWMKVTVVILRLGAGLWFLAACAGLTSFTMPKFGFVYGLPLAWLMVAPLHDGPLLPAERARLWVAWVLVWQSLHAYPVAGSQMNWGTFLWVPVFTMGWCEALRLLADRAPRLRLQVVAAGSIALAIGSGAAVWDLGHKGYTRYVHGTPLGLPGAEDLRLPDDLRSALRLLYDNVQTHSGQLFSFPGLYSFNVWTGKPTPTLANATHWFSLLSEEQQQAIIARLKTDPRACLIVQRFVVDFLHANGFATTSPLLDYLAADFEPALRIDTYELWVHRGRSIAPYDTARLSPDAADGGRRLELIVSHTDSPIARIEVRDLFPPYELLENLPIDSAHPVGLTPIDETGAPIGPSETCSTMPRLVQPTRISVRFSLMPRPVSAAQLSVLLCAPDGHTAGELRFVR